MNIVKKVKMVILSATSLVVSAASAGGRVSVTLTDDSHHDPGSGYYIKYSLNGNTYRSDEMGPKANAIAWENMSDEDKEKTVAVYTFYEDRKEQFGEEAAIKMGKWYNRAWIEGAKILEERLASAHFPEWQKKFSDPGYFEKTYKPTACSEDDMDQYVELKTRYAAMQMFYSSAQQAYSAMRQADYKRTQVAVMSASGDIISLICDKALVPGITPSGALGGVESMWQQIFSEVLEYGDKISGCSDEIVEKVVGKRVTSDVAVDVMTLMGEIVTFENHIIERCLDACETLRDQIDEKFAELKEEEEQYMRHWGEKAMKAYDAYEAIPMPGNPDPAHVAEKEALEKAIEEKRGPVETAQERYGRAQAAFLEVIDSSGDVYWAARGERDAALEALEAAQAAYDAECKKLNDFYDGIYNDLRAKQDAFIAKYEQAMAEHAAAIPTNRAMRLGYPGLEQYQGSYTSLELDADSVAPMEGALESYLAEYVAFADRMDEWRAEGTKLSMESQQECSEILSTAQIFSEGSFRRLDFAKAWDCADRVRKACSISAEGRERADADRYAKEKRLEMEDFLARWGVYNDFTIPELKKRAEELERKKTELHLEIVDAYNGAYDKLDASLDALPSYVKSQTMCISGPVITEKSELTQRFLARDATGTVKEALAVRDELDKCATNYRNARNEVRVVERRIHAFEKMYGTFDNFVPQQKKAMSRPGASLKADYAAGFKRRTISEEKLDYVSPLLALERDFKNYTYAHCTMLDQLGELNVNKELYSTNVLEDATQDPYVRTAYAARCLSATPKPGYYTTSASIVMPGYYVGYGKTPYEIAMLEASDRNRGTCSYTYFIAGYAAAAGNVVSDPFDNHIKPLLDEIDAARAAVVAAREKSDDPGVDPGEDDGVDPDGPGDSAGGQPVLVDEAGKTIDVTGGEVAPYSVAATVYDGYVVQDGVVKGAIQVKVAKGKANRSTGAFEAKVTATVLMAGETKKLSFRGGTADETGHVTGLTAMGGQALEVSLGVDGMGGALNGKTIDGARNIFSARDPETKQVAADVLKKWQGAVNLVGDGYTLSLAIATKGKVKVTGMVNGVKVTATSQLLIGEKACCIPVVITKKANLAANVWLMDDGTIEVSGIEGAVAGKAGALKSGAKVRFGDTASKELAALPGLFGEYLPDGLAVSQNGTKWVVAGGARAGKVAYIRGTTEVDETKAGANPSGLKLTYKAKDGSIKGSFKAYTVVNGRIKANSFTVTGVMVGNVGYCTATLKKSAVSFPITIE